MKRHTYLLVGAILATASLVACSNSGSSTATDASSTVTIENDSDDTAGTGNSTATSPPGSSGGSGTGSEFCVINDELNASEPPLDGLADPATVQAYFTGYFADAMSRAAAAAPPEIADDVATLVAGIADITEFLEGKNWDVEAAYADPEFITLFAADEFNQAGARVDAYCGA